MAHRNTVTAVPLATIAFSGLDNVSFNAINSAGLDEACFIIRIVNDTDGDLLISYNGTTTHERIAAINTFTTEPHTLAVPLTRNNIHENTEWKKGQIIYGKYDGSAATSGNIYISGYHNSS